MNKFKFDANCAKRVSYLLVTRNKAKYLERTLAKLRKIKKKNDELIVIDGASFDKTPEILRRYRSTIDILVSEKDLGGTHAANKGILLAGGKYIKQMPDDDDFNWLEMERAINLMEEHSEIDFLVCGGMKEFKGKSWPFYVPKGVDYGGNFENIFKYGGCGVGFIIRRSSIALIGLYPQDHITSDLAYILQAVRLGANVKFCRLNVFNHKIFRHSRVITEKDAMAKDILSLVKDYCSFKFYIKYKYRENINRIAIFFPPIIFAIKLIKRNKKYEIIWDGGFS